MESDKNMEIIEKAIRKLMEDDEINTKTSSCDESVVAIPIHEEDNEKAGGRHRQRRLLSKLLSELESMEEDNNITEESKQEANVDDINTLSSQIDEKTNTKKAEDGSCSNEEEIIKELKNVKRQNVITHCLLTALIVVTVAWQLSEVSLILRIKDGLTNPFKSVGGLVKGFWKRRHEVNIQDVMKKASEGKKQIIEPTYLPGLKIPELPNLELPGFDTSEDDDD